MLHFKVIEAIVLGFVHTYCLEAVLKIFVVQKVREKAKAVVLEHLTLLKLRLDEPFSF